MSDDFSDTPADALPVSIQQSVTRRVRREPSALDKLRAIDKAAEADIEVYPVGGSVEFARGQLNSIRHLLLPAMEALEDWLLQGDDERGSCSHPDDAAEVCNRCYTRAVLAQLEEALK